MTMSNQSSASPLYAVIDLGSNSFHMLIARLIANGVQTVDKVKRKVRLASGLNENNELSEEAMARGLECLSFFAERLQDIEAENIRIVATATLRIATNAEEFIRRAELVLGKKVIVLTGEQEAQAIYLGVAHTSEGNVRRMVLDIGGASTEIAIGGEFDLDKAISLDIGCVTYKQKFFSDNLLNESNFEHAINQAKSVLAKEKAAFLNLGWQMTLGGSGTMQAIAEVLMTRNLPAVITADILYELKGLLIECGDIDTIEIEGLLTERKPVIASGLSILIALFESFNISFMQLSSGALREGLLYEMLPDMRQMNIRNRTINSLCERFHIDLEHANRVQKQALSLYQNHASQWQLDNSNIAQLLSASCALHEAGLLLSYKYQAQHGAYILKHADLPGFDQTERQLIVSLVQFQKADIDADSLANLAIVNNQQSIRLVIIMRLAIILCRRRRDDVLPEYQSEISANSITLSFSQEWLTHHPLLADELMQENKHLAALGYQLIIN